MTDPSRSTTTTLTKRMSQSTRRQEQGVFQIHDPVELHGVTVMPAFNGLVGRIHAFDPTSGIYTIRHELSDNNDKNNNDEESSSYAQVFREQEATNGVLMTRLSAKFLRPCTIKVRQRQQQEQVQEHEKAVTINAKKADTKDMKGATPINESTEWTTVARTKKTNKPFDGNRKPKKLSAFNRQHYNSSEEDGPSDDDLLRALRECCSQLKTTFYWQNWTQTELFQNWKQKSTQQSTMVHGTVGDSSFIPLLKSIVCYGIGNFGSTNPMVTKRSCWSPSLLQLSLALTIQEAILEDSTSQNVDMLYFEPCMTPQEKRILEKLGIHILAKNEQGCHQVKTTPGFQQGPHSTLFFMPHCPISLYTNVLFTNWEWEKLQHVVLFGNKLSSYVENEWGNPSTQEVLKRLRQFWTEIALPTYTQDDDRFPSQYLRAFGDGALTYFFPASGAVDLPERPLESWYLAENFSNNEVV